jgi:hypothetical protein
MALPPDLNGSLNHATTELIMFVMFSFEVTGGSHEMSDEVPSRLVHNANA